MKEIVDIKNGIHPQDSIDLTNSRDDTISELCFDQNESFFKPN